MLTKQQQRDVIRASEAVAEVLCATVQATLEERSAEPARETLREIAALGEQAPDPDDDAIAVVTTYVLLHLVTLVQEELAERPEAVDQILAWIEDNLGKRYRLRARYVSVALRGAEGVDEIAEYRDALGSDFVPAIIWLLAGAVGCFGQGDAEWLRQLRPIPM